MTDHTITATLHSAERIGTSTNGNPSWLLHTSEGTYRTMSDSGAGYEVANVLPRHGQPDPVLHMTLTRAGRVRYFQTDAERQERLARCKAAHPAGKGLKTKETNQ